MTSPARKDPLPSIITRGSTYCYRTGPLTGTELGDRTPNISSSSSVSMLLCRSADCPVRRADGGAAYDADILSSSVGRPAVRDVADTLRRFCCHKVMAAGRRTRWPAARKASRPFRCADG